MSESTHSSARFGHDLTQGSIPRHLVTFSLPMLAGNLIQTAYSIINAVWVGKGLGKRELAAVTVSFPVVFVLLAVAGGLTMATGILVAQYAGARNWARLKVVVQTSVALAIGISAVLLPVGELLTPLILSRMQTPPGVLPEAISYMRIFLLSMPFGFGTFLVVSMLRGVGDSKTPLYFQAGSLLLTAIFDPILMFGWLGFPRLGLNGTAVASVSAQALGVVALFLYLHHKDHVVAPNWRKLRADWPTAWLLLKIGFPSAVQQSFISIGMLFVTGFVNAFGENATAAFGAALRIDQIAFLPAMTFSMAVATLVGQNIGAGRLNRVPEVFRWGIALSGGVTLPLMALMLLAPHLLLRMFVDDAQVMRIGISYLRIIGASYIFMAVLFVGNGVLNGAGHTLATTLIALVSLWVVRVPLAAYLTARMGRVEGVWWAMAASSVASMLVSMGCYYAGLWKRPVGAHSLVQDARATEDAEGEDATASLAPVE